MPQNDVIRARIDPKVKKEATAVLKEVGMTPSGAFRLMMVRIAREKALPFEPLVPNAETIAAMQELEQSNRPGFATVKDLLKDLNEGN